MREGCVLDVHPSTVAVAIDRAMIVLEMLAIRAGERGDTTGQAAWLIAKDAMDRACETFREARKAQSNRRNATGGGTVEFKSEELYLRFVLKTILDLLKEEPWHIGVPVYNRAREILEGE